MMPLTFPRELQGLPQGGSRVLFLRFICRMEFGIVALECGGPFCR